MYTAKELTSLYFSRMITLADLEGYYKVAQLSSYSFVDATFWNPETGEEYCEMVKDYDCDAARENDELYHAPVDEAMRRVWLHSKGEILKGDIVRVVKGRKLPIGKVGKVADIRVIRDKYQRPVADYIYFEDGTRTNINNCVMEQAI